MRTQLVLDAARGGRYSPAFSLWGAPKTLRTVFNRVGRQVLGATDHPFLGSGAGIVRVSCYSPGGQYADQF